jgi:arginyl-tRNA synthetase
MQTDKQIISAVLSAGLAKLQLPGFALEVNKLERPTQLEFGDYSTSICLSLFKQLSPEQKQQFQSPKQLAESLVSEITAQLQSVPEIDHVSVAGPGFVNFFLSLNYFSAQLESQLNHSEQLISQVKKPGKIVVEYSSPNIAKPFTIGHLRSTIIGDSVAKILTAVGHQVYRDNHIGDWGTQFGKQIYAIKAWGNEAELDAAENPAKELVALYVRFHQEAEENPELNDAGRSWFKKLEDGDPEARRLWKKCIDWSWKEFNAIYEKLDVSFTENGGRGYGESFFEDKMTAVIDELKAKNILVDSEGAQLVFFADDLYPPLMVTKKDGSTLYATRDLATDKFRLHHYGPEVTIINEVGAEQQLYFKQLYEVERLLGWTKPGQRIHVKHGLIRFKDGKMSTRKGNVIWLEEVLSEAFNRAKAIAGERLDATSLWQIAIGALKWNDLKRSSEINVVFDWDEAVRLDGNSGPYIQYAYTRCSSILQQNDFSSEPVSLTEATAEDLALVKILAQFDETVQQTAETLAPHHLCTYLFNLAQTFSSLYSKHQILKAETAALKTLRLQLTRLTAVILKQGLALLGISVLQKM